MFSLQRTLTLNYLGQHPARNALVVASIALGVAAWVGTQALNRGLHEATLKGINPLTVGASLLLTNGSAGVPADLAREIREAHPAGVVDARPVVLARAAIADLKHRADQKYRSVWLWGLDWQGAAAALGGSGRDNPWGVRYQLTFRGGLFRLFRELWAGRAFALVDSDLAEALKQEKPADPDHFTVRLSGKQPEITVLGTVHLEGTPIQTSDNLVLLDVTSASALVFPNDPGMVNQINVYLEPGADPLAARRALQEWLGQRALVQTPEGSQAKLQDVSAGLELGLKIGGAGALVIGMFLVYNILSVAVAERRHDIGILRSVGATRGQISRLFVTEAAGMGLLGSLLGLPLGMGLAWLACGPLSRVISEVLVKIETARIDASPRVLLVALVAGTSVAILAALVPALQAAQEEPADAVRRVPRRKPWLLIGFTLGCAVLLLGLGTLFVQMKAHLPTRFGLFGGFICLLIGAVVATPFLAALLGRFFQPLFRYLLGLEGRLAADNLVRTPGRTGLVIAALAVTGGLMVQTAGFIRSTEDAIYQWVEEKIAADLVVTSGSAVTAGGLSQAMDERLLRELRQLEDVQAVLPARFYQLDFRNHIVFMIALGADAFDQGGQDRNLARTFARHPRFRRPHTCLVSENFAAIHGIHPGDHFTIPGRDGEPLDLEVLGTVVDYTWNRGTILVNREWYRKDFADQQIDILDVFLEPGADAEKVKDRIEERWSDQEALIALTRPKLHEEFRAQLRRIYSMAYAQEIVIGLVALLGVASALIISVLQRRRELGLLRAVGATRKQVLFSVLAEAVLMGLIGVSVGFGVGLVLEWYVLDVILLDEAGFVFPMKVPWVEAGVVALASVVSATLAGLWPAYQATLLRIPEAIAYE
jgi:putative ABC transport system permease protein